MAENKKTNETIKKFWDDQAGQYQQQGLATCPDEIDRELEIDSIAKYIKDGKKVLDIGCGNGYSTIKFAQKYKNIKITGIDYSEEMIRHANVALDKLDKNLKNRIKFMVGDVLLMDFKEKFDIITTSRCLINLVNFNQQKQAIKNIHKLLNKGGSYIMCENTLDGLERINLLRKIVGLEEIPMRWHNQYFNEKTLIKFLRLNFKILDIDNFDSLYYVASRVFNAKLTPEGQKPDYNAGINKIAAKLPSVGDFSPTKIFVLRKK